MAGLELELERDLWGMAAGWVLPWEKAGPFWKEKGEKVEMQMKDEQRSERKRAISERHAFRHAVDKPAKTNHLEINY